MAGRLSCRRYLADGKRCGQLKYLSEKDLQSLDISMTEVVESMEDLIGVQAQGKAWIAPKTNVTASSDRFMIDGRADDRPHIDRCRYFRINR